MINYGDFHETKISKIFDNIDFGYSLITVERPLRLKFQITEEREISFLENLPEAFHVFQILKSKFRTEEYLNWNEVFDNCKKIFKKAKESWGVHEKKLFRDVFTEIDPLAEKVILRQKKGANPEYEPDSKLRDFENVPLKDDIDAYMKREVLPFVDDAWIDYSKTKIGYEINFNRYFFEFKQSRKLEVIDKELNDCEKRIMKLLSEVVE